ncbi:MAG: peptidoglycan DD-metalloendopeptidase family protein [Gammaproteobacteria bacterium]
MIYKFLKPADKALTALGRFLLTKPLLGILLFSSILSAIFWHNIVNSLGFGSSVHENWEDEFIVLPPAEMFTRTASHFSNAATVPPTKPVEVAVAAPEAPAQPEAAAPAQEPDHWEMFRLRPGDNLAKVFKKYHISATDLLALSKQAAAKPLLHLMPGQTLRLSLNNHKLQQLVYFIGPQDKVVVNRSGDEFQIKHVDSSQVELAQAAAPAATPMVTPIKPAVTTNYIAGKVHRNLAVDAKKSGLSAHEANQLAQLFTGQKVHAGDSFNVLLDHAKTATSAIAVAVLNQSGKTTEYIRYTDPKGHTDYYSPNGQSLHKGILRAPLAYSHISSYFSKSRFQPILHFFRPHLGVDYAAPTGTPIKAAGDGVIVQMERRGGYGNSIEIKHDSTYTTLYAHMARYADDIRVGSTVKQGDVIGYVGSTGLATGPHLHYEIRVHNLAMNPLTVQLPEGALPASYRPQFLAKAKVLLAQLRLNEQRVATQDKHPSHLSEET